MQSVRIKNLAVIGLGLFVVIGCASMAGGGGGLRSCSGASNALPIRRLR